MPLSFVIFYFRARADDDGTLKHPSPLCKQFYRPVTSAAHTGNRTFSALALTLTFPRQRYRRDSLSRRGLQVCWAAERLDALRSSVSNQTLGRYFQVDEEII